MFEHTVSQTAGGASSPSQDLVLVSYRINLPLLCTVRLPDLRGLSFSATADG